ncbi:MAG: HAMP domain-containing protein [Cryomorphaceae bacterium]|nr:HAMP domain-containing protein [Cryomorphaceae bacterium]
MTITARQSLLFTLITAIFLLLFSLFLDYSAAQTREKEFYGMLEKEALTKLNLIAKAKIDASTLQTIYRENRTILNEVEVAIFDSDFHLLYHDDIDIDFVKETPEMLEEIRSKKKITFMVDQWQVIGLRIDDGENFYLITAAAYDYYGFTKLHRQRQILAFSNIIGLLILYFAGRFFARKTMRPLSRMVEETRNISARNLHRRLPEGRGKDELEQLAVTFNNMLERLDNAFASQRSFVSNISHELRTPLSGILAEIELALKKEMDQETYRQVLKSIQSDARNLTRLSESLLNLAKAEYDNTAIHFSSIRVDELLLDALADVQRDNENAKVEMHFDTEGSEEEMLVKGNAYLLKVAFHNVLDNACKFSKNQKVEVFLRREHKKVFLIFKDQGPGIPEADMALLFEPFFRGKNHRLASGAGIGLSLLKRIIDQHNGEIEVSANAPKGIIFTLSLPLV